MAFDIRTFLFNTMCLLCGCVFIIFEIQSTIFDHSNSEYSLPPPAAYHSLGRNEKLQKFVNSILGEKKDKKYFWHVKGKKYEVPKIWITMGLCWSSNAQVYGKQNFPYKGAAPLSSQLWMKISPAIQVLLHVVYSEPKPSEELLKYKEELEGFGTKVKLIPTSSSLTCVLESQLIRVLAYLVPEVKDNDIIVTSDVDAFPMTNEMIAPLVRLKERSIWLYRYGLTYASGATFMMAFIGAKAHVWRDILKYDYNPKIHSDIGQGLPQWIEKYAQIFTNGNSNINNITSNNTISAITKSSNNTYTWEVDQLIISRAILESGLCTLPANNSLWAAVNLKHQEKKEFNDTLTCWRGSGKYEDCNNRLLLRNARLRQKGGNCKWWHFYPDEKIENLEEKFQEIMDGRQEGGIINRLVDSMRISYSKVMEPHIFDH